MRSTVSLPIRIMAHKNHGPVESCFCAIHTNSADNQLGSFLLYSMHIYSLM